MTTSDETAASGTQRGHARPKRKASNPLGYILIFMLPVALYFGVRFFGVQPFRIPSSSMQPAVQVGDYIVVQKWSYGYSRYSIAPLQGFAPAGRIFVHLPERGDIAVFRPEPEPDRDFIKRIIGIPGDRVAMRGGAVVLNGKLLPRESVGEVVVNDERGAERYRGFRETLPNGVSYIVLDRGTSELDDTAEFVVPPGHYFVMGDDRDNSADSRVPSVVGMVPLDNLIGKMGADFGGSQNR